MARPAPWATKVAAVIQAGNKPAALAQIKVAPSVRELQALRALMMKHTQWKTDKLLLQAVDDQVASLSHPRLHRSP